MNEYQKNLLSMINKAVTNNLAKVSLRNPLPIETKFMAKKNATLRSTPTAAVKINIIKTYPSVGFYLFGVTEGKSTNVSDPYLWYSVVEEGSGVNGFLRSDQVVRVSGSGFDVSKVTEAQDDTKPIDTNTNNTNNNNNTNTNNNNNNNNTNNNNNNNNNTNNNTNETPDTPDTPIKNNLDLTNKTPIIGVILLGLGAYLILKK
jgi:hypothetical protein